MFERIEFSTKEKELSKDDFAEVSIKYQDMFEMDLPKKEKIQSTLEMNIPSVKSKEEAISGLTSAQFVHFLTGVKVSPTQLATINQIQNYGFSSKSINLVIDYSYEVNGSIVSAHIKKIAQDMITKDIKDASSVEAELDAARASRKSLIKAEKAIVLDDVNSSENWDDLFKSLGGDF